VWPKPLPYSFDDANERLRFTDGLRAHCNKVQVIDITACWIGPGHRRWNRVAQAMGNLPWAGTRGLPPFPRGTGEVEERVDAGVEFCRTHGASLFHSARKFTGRRLPKWVADRVPGPSIHPFHQVNIPARDSVRFHSLVHSLRPKRGERRIEVELDQDSDGFFSAALLKNLHE